MFDTKSTSLHRAIFNKNAVIILKITLNLLLKQFAEGVNNSFQGDITLHHSCLPFIWEGTESVQAVVGLLLLEGSSVD